MNTLNQLYQEHKGKLSDKWQLYLNVYDEIFLPFKDVKINLLEIGVQNGGSLEIWAKYFQFPSKLIGCDINVMCLKHVYENVNIKLVIGDANDDKTKLKILKHADNFDIIIDDGSHYSGDIIKSFIKYFGLLNDNGLFVIEDLHCSYWKTFEGGTQFELSSISFLKKLIDMLNFEHWEDKGLANAFFDGFKNAYNIDIDLELFTKIHSIQFVNSMCIIKKKPKNLNLIGKRVIAGEVEGVTRNIKLLQGTSSSSV